MLAKNSLRGAAPQLTRWSNGSSSPRCTIHSLSATTRPGNSAKYSHAVSSTTQCRTRPSILDSSTSHARSYTTDSSDSSTSKPTKPTKPTGSIFDTKESAWDHVFEGIKDGPALSSSTSPTHHRPYTPRTYAGGAARRQGMTAREISVFDEMFTMLFNAASNAGEHQGPRMLSPTSGIGKSRQMGDLFGSLRRHSKRIKWTSEEDEELDRKKEEMDLCDTDQQLLEWAMREVFEESKRYEEAARVALNDPEALKTQEPIQLQPPSYPHLLAALMKTFRDKYSDPHLALSMFDHARHLSIASYVFGCTTPAYNELIETRWRCFRDLRGVCDALDEMRINGVEMDNRTRALAETIRAEVGERNLWEEGTSSASGEAVWEMVEFIERLTARGPPKDRKGDVLGIAANSKKAKWSKDQEGWKSRALKENDPSDDWEFGQWGDSRQQML